MVIIHQSLEWGIIKDDVILTLCYSRHNQWNKINLFDFKIIADRMDISMDHPSFDLQSIHVSFEVKYINNIKKTNKK